MGIIRKSLMIGTGGVVRGSSKKQRVAKAQLQELRRQTDLAEAQADAAGIETSGHPKGSLGDRLWERKRAKSAAEAATQAPAPAAPAAPPPGWYPSPQKPGQMQWWDGAHWAESYAPAS